MSMRRVVLTAAASVLLLVPLGASPAVAKKAPSAKKQVAVAYKLLTRETKTTPAKALSKRNRAKLLRVLGKSRRQSRRNPCRAVRTLRAYRRGLRAVRIRKIKGRRPTGSSFRGDLQSGALRVNVALMQLPRARRCGGGRRPKQETVTSKVLGSNAKRLRLRLSLPSPTFSSHQVGGQDFQQMFMEGLGETGDVGKPGVPTLTEFFGVPDGASIKLKINETTGYDLDGVNLYPHQKAAVDLELPKGAPPVSTFADPPFRMNDRAYDSNRAFPAKPAHAGPLGNLRSLNMGGVDFAGAKYRPKSDSLHVFTSIDVTVNFAGDNTGTFGDAGDFANTWEVFYNRNYRRVVRNFEAVSDNLRDIHPGVWCGEEMLVITSPALATAAETFRAGKVAQGISTSVRFVGSGPGQIGTTQADIQAFIRNRLNGGCLIRPTYVVLLGNTAAVPTWLVPCGPGGNPDECNIASDLPYSLNGLSTDLFADVMLGRIPVTDPADADAVVNKILTYQTTPPAPPGDDFYDHATVTSYFQPAMHCVLNEGASGVPNCNAEAPPVTGHWEINHANHTDTRGFTKTSEAVRNAMAANGYSVQRLYTTDDEDVIPEFYYDGTPIPAHLRRPTFAWDANTTDFLDEYNAGRFLILHRDHGWPDGWAEPTIHSGHVPFLTNGSEQPVVFGINCSSAAFDDPSHPSFVELQVRRIGGGAIAGFGGTPVSPSFPHNHMTRGFFDALFPNLQPEFGSSTPTRRLGDVLILGKQFMATQEGLDWHGAGDTYAEHYLYHLLGDPSMQMWADEPKQFVPPKIDTRYIPVDFPRPGDPPWKINIQFPVGGGEPPPFNTVATLFNNGEVLGRGIVNRGGFAEIIPEQMVEPLNLHVTFNQDGVLPAQDSVEGAPKKTQTSVTVQPPQNSSAGGSGVTTGQLSPGLAGAPIRLVYKNLDDSSENQTHTVMTNANGGYTDSIDFAPSSGPQDEDWTVQAFYDGNATYAASQSAAQSFVVLNNW
jgi:hypothetical protein